MAKPGEVPAPRLAPPGPVIEITRDLEGAGFQAWCVGGAVRDALLGHPHLDWDLATDATPDQVRTVFGRKRTIPVGIDFGTVGVLDTNGVMHEVTTFRRDVRTDGRHAVVEFGASLDEDLARRDFTVNAIAYSATTRELRDPFEGRKDLAAGLIRAVGDPHERMREDRLRALRGIRFAARFGFDIEPATWDGIRGSAPHLTRLSAERIKQELEKTMDQVAQPSGALRRWREAGAMAVLLPDLDQLSAEALGAVDCAAQPGAMRRPGRRLTRFAVLFSDLRPEAVFALATRLRFSKQDARWLEALVARWKLLDDRLSASLSGGRELAAADVRRLVAEAGRVFLAASFRVANARWLARGRLASGAAAPAAPAAHAVHGLYRRSLRAAARDPVDIHDLAVDGDDLRSVGVPLGPEVGKVLSTLLGIVLEDPAANTRDRLLAEVRRAYGRGNTG